MDMRILLDLERALGQFRRQEQWTHQQIEAHQAEELHRLRRYVYAHSPFYQEYHRGLTNRPLHELPVLTKAQMMENFDSLVTDRKIHLKAVEEHVASIGADKRFLGHYWVNATSGSTGRPGIFVFNRSEWATVIASFARAYEWGGIKVNLAKRRKMAVVASASPLHMSAQVGATVQSWWTPTLRLAASEPLDMIVQHLNDWQPEVLVSYASMARILADEQLGGRLQIAPRAVFTSSEVLTQESRHRIEEVWGKNLFNHYGATESGGLAAECSHHLGMHLYEDLVIFEVVDNQYRPVPAGIYGEKVLITVLFNRTQPLIRYELSDSIRLAVAPCSSGRPFGLIEDVQGRTEDILHFATDSGSEIAVHPNVFHSIMDTMPVDGWQVVHGDTTLTVLLAGAHDGFVDESLQDKLREALESRGVVVPPIEVRRVASIPKSSSGKAPLIQSKRARTSIQSRSTELVAMD